MKQLGYEAMGFGNHEFDDGLQGLVPFVKNISNSFVLVNSNMDSIGTDLDGTYMSAYEKTVGGEVIGIVGYTTVDTPHISLPGPKIKFRKETEALKEVVNELITKNNVNKIIALGHSGISVDREICKKVSGIDVVVGGHTNTFLYSGKAPSKEMIEGEYPEVYRDTGSPCLVVQDYAYGKYLGFLQVEFDDKGEVISWSGNPILLDTKFEEDPEVLEILEPYKKSIQDVKNEVVGQTAFAINGTWRNCRIEECNLGNLLADAAVHYYMITDPDSPSWTKAAICMWNGGGMRDFIADPWDNITLNDLYSILPYGNTLDRVLVTGRNIRLSLEQGLKGFSITDPKGWFFQVSGLKVVYNLNKPEGQRVVRVEARCSECRIPHYEPLDEHKLYPVISTSYVLGGGDGHKYMANYTFRDNGEMLDVDAVKDYIEKRSPILPQLEGRIRFVDQGESPPSGSANRLRIFGDNSLLVVVLCLFFVVNKFV